MIITTILSALHPLVNDALVAPTTTYGGMINRADLHTTFIVLHALGGILSFFSGSLFLAKSNARDHRRLFGLYFWSLIGMIGFLVTAMAVWWTQYSDFEQMVFPGLLALGFYMLYRAFAARSSVFGDELTIGYIHDIGFTLIALFEGFIIVFLINVDAPIGITVVVAILGVILGREAISRVEHQVINIERVA